MNFVDKVLVQLADPAKRKDVFDQAALGLLVEAAYRADEMGVAGPYTAHFDDVRLGFPLPPLGALDGAWQAVAGADRTQAEFKIAGLGGAAPPRIDALWRGAVAARFALSGEPVEAADAGTVPLPTLADVDAAIGTLPQDPDELEAARRDQVAADADATAPHPGSVTRALIDRWIRDGGFDGVAGLLAAAAAAPLVVEELRLSFAAPAAVSATARLLPLAVVILVRDAAQFSLAALLAESKEALQRVDALGLEPPRQDDTRVRRGVLAAWVVPAALFDDTDWPGANGGTPAAQRDARRATAGAWLAREGIGLVTVP